MTPKLVMVKWRDAFEGPAGWIIYSEYKPEEVSPVTVGWLFDDDQKLPGYLTLYSTYFGEGEELVVADPNHIPKEMVVTITTLTTQD